MYIKTNSTDTIFAPNHTLDRVMLDTILHRLANEPQANSLPPFTDVAEDA